MKTWGTCKSRAQLALEIKMSMSMIENDWSTFSHSAISILSSKLRGLESTEDTLINNGAADEVV